MVLVEEAVEETVVLVDEAVEPVDKAVAGVFVAYTGLPPEAVMLTDAGVVGSVTMGGAGTLVAVAEGSVTEAVMSADEAATVVSVTMGG